MKIKHIMMSMFAAVALMFTACEQDNEGAIYKPENQGASFVFNSYTESAPASAPIVRVPISRGVAASAATVSVSIETSAPGVTVNPTVSFEAGSYESTVEVNLGTELAVGERATININIADADASAGAIKTAKLTAYKEYEWKSLGKGQFLDNWICGLAIHEVEIQQAVGFERYRVMDPYKECLTNDDGEWGDWIEFNTRCKYIEFWVNADGTTVSFDAFRCGLNYQAGEGSIVYYPYTDFSGIESDHSLKLEEGTFQLAPYIYIDGLGGWNYTQQDGVVIIELP